MGLVGLKPPGVAAQALYLTLTPVGHPGIAAAVAPTSVALFEQGTVEFLQAAVTGLDPGHPYLLALSDHADGSGNLEPLAAFTTSPAGAAIVNAAGDIRRAVRAEKGARRRYLVIVPGTAQEPGAPVQVQAP